MARFHVCGLSATVESGERASVLAQHEAGWQREKCEEWRTIPPSYQVSFGSDEDVLKLSYSDLMLARLPSVFINSLASFANISSVPRCHFDPLVSLIFV